MPLSRMIEGEVGCRLLKSFSSHATASAYQSSERQTNASRLDTRFVRAMWVELRGPICIDFAHGHGNDVIEMGAYGAQRVIGIDAWDKALPISSGRARAAEIAKTCQFLGPTTNLPKDAALPEADVIFPLSALEHYDEPETIRQKVLGLLKLLGRVMARFGSFLWHAPVLNFFLAASAFRCRRDSLGPDLESDRATRFHVVSGGLNSMRVCRIRSREIGSTFSFKSFAAVPMHHLRWLHSAFTQEFFTSVARCTLVAN